MKTTIGHYYVFFDIDDFWKKVNYWKSKGIIWVHESHPDYNPILTKKDLPCVLNVDSCSMLLGIINTHKERYFNDPFFIKIYNQSLREYKLRKIENEI